MNSCSSYFGKVPLFLSATLSDSVIEAL